MKNTSIKQVRLYGKDLSNGMLAINRARQSEEGLLPSVEWKDFASHLSASFNYSKEYIRAIAWALYEQKCIDIFCIDDSNDLSETYIKQVSRTEGTVNIPRFMREHDYITVDLIN